MRGCSAGESTPIKQSASDFLCCPWPTEATHLRQSPRRAIRDRRAAQSNTPRRTSRRHGPIHRCSSGMAEASALFKLRADSPVGSEARCQVRRHGLSILVKITGCDIVSVPPHIPLHVAVWISLLVIFVSALLKRVPHVGLRIGTSADGLEVKHALRWPFPRGPLLIGFRSVPRSRGTHKGSGQECLTDFGIG